MTKGKERKRWLKMWRDSLTANEPFRLGLKILIVNLFKMVTSRVNVLNFWQIDSKISAFWIFMNFVAILMEKTWNCFDGQLDWLCRSIKVNFNIWRVMDRWHLENWRNYIRAGIHVGREMNWKFETKALKIGSNSSWMWLRSCKWVLNSRGSFSLIFPIK